MSISSSKRKEEIMLKLAKINLGHKTSAEFVDKTFADALIYLMIRADTN